jgi:hypothetical protein
MSRLAKFGSERTSDKTSEEFPRKYFRGKNHQSDRGGGQVGYLRWHSAARNPKGSRGKSPGQTLSTINSKG